MVVGCDCRFYIVEGCAWEESRNRICVELSQDLAQLDGFLKNQFIGSPQSLSQLSLCLPQWGFVHDSLNTWFRGFGVVLP